VYSTRSRTDLALHPGIYSGLIRASDLTDTRYNAFGRFNFALSNQGMLLGKFYQATAHGIMRVFRIKIEQSLGDMIRAVIIPITRDKEPFVAS